MPKFLLQVNYTSAGAAGVLRDGGTKRVAAAKKAAKSVGGRLDAMYFAFGDTDVYCLADMPDHASATALSLALAASGAVTARMTVLLSAAEVDQAAALTPAYVPPGT